MTGEDDNPQRDPDRSAVARASVLTAIRAATTLQRACAAGGPGAPGSSNSLQLHSLQLHIVSELSGQLGYELERSLEVSAPEHLKLVEALQRAADLANLAACAVPSLTGETSGRSVAGALEAAREAATAAERLGELAQVALDGLKDPLRENTRRDITGAGWKAGFALRQAEELASAEDTR